MYQVFSISQIRAQARQTISQTSGSYTLALVPVILSILMNVMSYAGGGSFSVDTITTGSQLNFNLIFSSFTFPILYGILLSLITLSISFALMATLRHQKEALSWKDALTIFNHPDFGKIFLTYLAKAFLLFLWGLVIWIGVGLYIFALAGILVYAMTYNDLSAIPDSEITLIGGLLLGGMLLVIIGLVIFYPQYYAYSMTDFVLYDRLATGTFTGAFATIKESRRIMKGYKGQRFVLDLTFIGWNILVGITFGLAGLYVTPYYYASQAHFYEAVRADRTFKASYMPGFIA